MLVLMSSRMEKGIEASVGIGIAAASSSAFAPTLAPTFAAAVLGSLPSHSGHVVFGYGKSTADSLLLHRLLCMRSRGNRWSLAAANLHVRPRRRYC